MCTFGLTKRAHLSAPALHTPPKFHEKDQQERENRIKTVAGKEKKHEILAPHPSGPHPSGLFSSSWSWGGCKPANALQLGERGFKTTHASLPILLPAHSARLDLLPIEQ